MDNRKKRTNREMKPLRCLQVNLQHKRAATSNLVQIINENQIDLVFVQESYIICNNLAGIPKSLRTYVSGNGRKRSALCRTLANEWHCNNILCFFLYVQGLAVGRKSGYAVLYRKMEGCMQPAFFRVWFYIS